MMREIAVFWRGYQIQAVCRFTTLLLKHLGCFGALVAAYFNERATSSYAEELGSDFLSSLCEHPTRLVSSMARFERAFLVVRAGSTESFEVLWDRHPDALFLALEVGQELPPPEPGWVYRMRIALEIPDRIECRRERASAGVVKEDQKVDV